MPYSERTFKINVKSARAVFIFCLGQQLFAFKEFCMKERLYNIFKTTNITKLTKAILKSSCRVLQVVCKWKTLKKPVYFLRAVEFWPIFDIQININLAMFWEKLKN